jgi:hypothetical protein
MQPPLPYITQNISITDFYNKIFALTEFLIIIIKLNAAKI